MNPSLRANKPLQLRSVVAAKDLKDVHRRSSADEEGRYSCAAIAAALRYLRREPRRLPQRAAAAA